MIPEIPFDKIIRTVMRHGAEFAEVFFEKTKRTWVICENRKIEQTLSSFEVGIGIRTIISGNTSYSSTNDLSIKNLLDLAKRTTHSSKLSKTKTRPIIFNEKPANIVTTVKNHPSGIALDNKCFMVLRANEIAWGISPKISQARITYRDNVRKIKIATSEGFTASDEQVDTLFTVHAVAADGYSFETAYEAIAGSSGFDIFEKTPPEEIAQKTAARAVMMLTAGPTPAAKMPVIISSEAGGTLIHEAVGHGLEADLACEGMSVYAGKLGQKVACEGITVIDDSSISGLRGSFTFDDEGEPAHRNILVENGVLKSYMFNKSAARKTGCSSTGNGRRQSYECVPIVRMTNTFIAPSNDDPASILMDTKTGLLVQKLGGGQVNTINGDFVFKVQEGYIIRNGRIAEPVRGATLTGNGPKVLMTIDRVGNDLGFSVGTCGKDGQDAPVTCGQPTIRIPQMVVGGTAI